MFKCEKNSVKTTAFGHHDDSATDISGSQCNGTAETEVRELMLQTLAFPGMHPPFRRATHAAESRSRARRSCALVNAGAKAVVIFTSGATEAITWF